MANWKIGKANRAQAVAVARRMLLAAPDSKGQTKALEILYDSGYITGARHTLDEVKKGLGR